MKVTMIMPTQALSLGVKAIYPFGEIILATWGFRMYISKTM